MVALVLTYAITTGQTVSIGMIESGPAFVENLSSAAQVLCEEFFFEACREETESAASTLGTNDKKGLIARLSVVAVVCAIAIGFLICSAFINLTSI